LSLMISDRMQKVTILYQPRYLAFEQSILVYLPSAPRIVCWGKRYRYRCVAGAIISTDSHQLELRVDTPHFPISYPAALIMIGSNYSTTSFRVAQIGVPLNTPTIACDRGRGKGNRQARHRHPRTSTRPHGCSSPPQPITRCSSFLPISLTLRSSLARYVVLNSECEISERRTFLICLVVLASE
jgi:hypothetical protein